MKIGTGTTYTIRGVLAILTGGLLLLLLFPSLTLLQLAILLTAYFLLEGLVAFIVGLNQTETGRTRWYLMGGGVLNLCWAALTFLAGGKTRHEVNRNCG